MAAPNTLSLTSVTLKTAMVALTTVTANIITNSVSSNTVDKINDIIVCNYSSSAINANVMVNRSSVPYYVAGNISVPAYSTLVVTGKDTAIYLEEGDVLQANVSANTAAHIVASYELVT
jgi:hypothetical protein